MLKKAGFVTATAAGLMLIAAPAFAATEAATAADTTAPVTYSDAYHQFIKGGGALGYGAASVLAGAYTAVFETPQNVYDNADASGVLGG